MASISNDDFEARKRVVLRGVEDWQLLDLRAATRIAPESLAWVQLVAQRERCNHKVDVTVSVSQPHYEALTAGLTRKRDIARVIENALFEEALSIIEHDHLRDEIGDIPRATDQSVFGPLTLVVEWTTEEAYAVKCATERSALDVGCIEMTRLGAMGAKSVVLAVSLPLALFNAAMTRYQDKTTGGNISDCVLAAILEASDAEPRLKPQRSEFTDDEIPF